MASWSTPSPLVVLAWGSQSMSSVFFSITASAAERLMDVVVFPTPPFWLATHMTRAMLLKLLPPCMFHVEHEEDDFGCMMCFK